MNETSNTLTPEQRAAVESPADQILVLAGPGSGKTRTIVARVIHLVRDRKVRCDEIVCVTYTNDAANEIKKRLGDEQIHGLGFVGTLHSFCLHLVRTSPCRTGWLPRDVTVLDQFGAERMLINIARDMGVKTSDKKILRTADAWKHAIPATGGICNQTAEQKAAIEYFRQLRLQSLVDFDGLLFYGLLEIEAMTQHCRWPFKHVLWDELQDSSDNDFKLLLAMCALSKFVVGDPDQGIYGFRGGNVMNIVRLADLGGQMRQLVGQGWELHTLEVNYRSGRPIAQAAQALIEHNVTRYGKKTIAAKEYGEVEVVRVEMAKLESSVIKDHLLARSASHGFKPSDCAVLCRTNQQVKELSDELRARSIPVNDEHYTEPGGWGLAKATLAMVAQPRSESAARNYLHFHHGIEGTADIVSKARLEMKSLCEYTRLRLTDPAEWLQVLVAAGVSRESRALLVTISEGCSNVQDLLMAAYAYKGIRTATTDGVTVTTCHAAKGREWELVIVAGCEEKYLPSKQAMNEPAALEEERRLMFVAMTRAMSRLVLTWCAERPLVWPTQSSRRGSVEPRERSRFITEAGLKEGLTL